MISAGNWLLRAAFLRLRFGIGAAAAAFRAFGFGLVHGDEKMPGWLELKFIAWTFVFGLEC